MKNINIITFLFFFKHSVIVFLLFGYYLVFYIYIRDILKLWAKSLYNKILWKINNWTAIIE